MPDPWTHPLPPDTRAVGTGDPANDEDANVDAVTAMGAGFNILNPAFGADPTGSGDCTTAIVNADAAALAAVGFGAAAATVFYPPGLYKTSATVTTSPGVTHQGSAGWPGQDHDGTCFVPQASFTGTSVFAMITTSGTIRGTKFKDFSIDGSALGGTVAGITGTGSVWNAVIENVYIYKVSGAGIDMQQSNGTGQPVGWRVRHCKIDTTGGNGMFVGPHTDGEFLNVHCIGTLGHGWSIAGAPANSRFTACRAEWAGTGKDGFHIVGAWNTGTGAGGLTFTGCSTDRNDNYGMNINVTAGTGPILITGCMFRRDGRNAGTGGFAGIAVNATTIPVMIDNCFVFPGVDDNGTQTNSPTNGMTLTGTSTLIAISNCVFHANTTGISGAGTGASYRNVWTRTGTTAAPTAPALTADTA